jgi:hypothetical protein
MGAGDQLHNPGHSLLALNNVTYCNKKHGSYVSGYHGKLVVVAVEVA